MYIPMAAPKKMQQRIRVSLFLDEQQKAHLDRLAVKWGRPWAELVRVAIDDLLRRPRRIDSIKIEKK